MPKDAHDGAPWPQWEPDVAAGQLAALARQCRQLERKIRRHIFVQYLFFRQWTALKEYVSSRGIHIIGDAPIFAAHDSADCWAHRELSYLAPEGRPTLVAGMPRDYFSATGQLWGNPLYRWDVLGATGYAWWINRLRTALSLVDVLRLDHFRGFAAYWAILGDAPTAVPPPINWLMRGALICDMPPGRCAAPRLCATLGGASVVRSLPWRR